jgi:hypothetical protein
MGCWGRSSRLLNKADGGGKERKGFALSRSPTRVDIYVEDCPGPFMVLKINNISKVEETQFPPGVLEGQSPSIFAFHHP